MGSASFTLIEIIGVMALMAILAAVVVPPLFRTLEDAQSVDEDANLEAIAQALVRGIQAYGRFPNPNVRPDETNNGWVTLAKNFYPKGTNQLRYVFPRINNFSETERRVYLEPILVQNLATAGSFGSPPTGFSATADLDGNGVPDFSQSLRMYIVSSSKRDLFLYCSKNQPSQMMNPAPQDAPTYGAALLSDLQNWVKEFEPPGSPNFGNLMVPQSIARWGTASGLQYRRGEYLHVKVVDLSPLICRANLRDLAAPPTAVVSAPPGTHSYPANTGDPVDGSALGYTFDFMPNGGFGNPFAGGENGTLTTSLNQRILIDKTAALAGFIINDNGIPPVVGSSQFSLTLPLAPQWEVNSFGPNPFPPNINSFSIYLIKGTNLRLYDSAGLSLLLSTQVTADSNFEYFNGSWTRVD